MNKVFKVGLIGCGHISETYFRGQQYFNNFKIVACADIDNKAAIRCAKLYNIKFKSSLIFPDHYNYSDNDIKKIKKIAKDKKLKILTIQESLIWSSKNIGVLTLSISNLKLPIEFSFLEEKLM